MQRVEQSLREQERALAKLVSERLDRSEQATGQIVTELRERLAGIDAAQKKCRAVDPGGAGRTSCPTSRRAAPSARSA